MCVFSLFLHLLLKPFLFNSLLPCPCFSSPFLFYPFALLFPILFFKPCFLLTFSLSTSHYLFFSIFIISLPYLPFPLQQIFFPFLILLFPFLSSYFPTIHLRFFLSFLPLVLFSFLTSLFRFLLSISSFLFPNLLLFPIFTSFSNSSLFLSSFPVPTHPFPFLHVFPNASLPFSLPSPYP